VIYDVIAAARGDLRQPCTRIPTELMMLMMPIAAETQPASVAVPKALTFVSANYGRAWPVVSHNVSDLRTEVIHTFIYHGGSVKYE